jgi:two-component system sensor histidine kinase MprB
VSLRRRLVLLTATAVAVGVVLAAAVAYVAVRNALRGEVDGQLRAQQQLIARAAPQGVPVRPPSGLPQLPARRGGPAAYLQIVGSDGNVDPLREEDARLPVTARIRAIARGDAPSQLVDLHVDGAHLRMAVAPLPSGGAVQIARSLDPIDRVLGRMRLILLLVCLAGITLSALVARVVARRVLAPVADLTAAAEHIEATHDLTRRIASPGDDEVGRLARRFNAMLDELQRSHDALDESVVAQRRLVADASHELRTPITSLRMNIELLEEAEELGEEERRSLRAAVAQSEELTALVGDVIELGRGDEPLRDRDDVRLDAIVTEALDRARRNFTQLRFTATLEPVTIFGSPERLGRAVNNLLDNAAKHSPSGAVVEVVVDDRGLVVRDHGTGIPPEVLPHVFDRFFRGADSRGREGSGLGLAIVKQAIEQHDGLVTASNATDGGAVFTVELPDLIAVEPANIRSGQTAGKIVSTSQGN